MKLHLSVKKDFSYLNYLSVMSAILGNDVKMWVVEEPVDNKYWDIVKKVESIEFVETTPEKGITLDENDKVGRLDAIYLGELGEGYINEYGIDHTGLYESEDTGEFESKDMTIVKIFQPEVVTLEYIRDSKTLLSALVKLVLLERVWNR